MALYNIPSAPSASMAAALIAATDTRTSLAAPDGHSLLHAAFEPPLKEEFALPHEMLSFPMIMGARSTPTNQILNERHALHVSIRRNNHLL